jgi:hypothetical protein
MFDPFNSPALQFDGHISHPQINNGQPLPLFQPVAPEGRPSINTLDGWNQLVAETERRHREAVAVK